MAEALARRDAPDIVEPASAGISPFGRVVEPTRLVLLEKGRRIDGQFSKGLSDATLFRPDLVINMTGIPGASLFAQARYQEWDVEYPYGCIWKTIAASAKILKPGCRSRPQLCARMPRKLEP